jgi:5-methylcytosine-specific restriction endonuclease McrA
MNKLSSDYYTTCKFAKKPIKKAKRETVNKDTYQKVFEACKGKCVLCGTTQQLQLHHIYSRGKDLTNKVTNCVMLCMNCHLYKVHRNQHYYRPILNEITKEIY